MKTNKLYKKILDEWLIFLKQNPGLTFWEVENNFNNISGKHFSDLKNCRKWKKWMDSTGSNIWKNMIKDLNYEKSNGNT